jgi:hypothetical protein
VGEGPQLRELGQEGAGERGSDAGDAAQESLVLTPDRTRLDDILEVSLGALKLFLQPPEVGSNALLDGTRNGSRETVVLSDEHTDQLAAPVDDLAKEHGFLVGQRLGLGLERLGETGEDIGVNSVGFGQGACRLGEVPHLAGIDYRNRDT